MVASSIEGMMAGKGPAPVCEIFSDAEDRHGFVAPAKRRFKGNAQHYVKVLTMAALTPVEAQTLASPELQLSFVVPVYNTSARHLDDLYASFRAQPEGTAELVLSDDGSTLSETRTWLSAHANAPFVKMVASRDNRGIAAATNAGIAAARGAWVGLVDHDDALSPFAVARILDALHEHPEAAFLYTDEVITDGALKPVGYHMKPAYDPVLLSGVNYINHLSLYRRARLLAIGSLRSGFDGSQDYDLLLRYLAGLPRHEILHLPFPAYLWRRHDQSFSTTSLDRALKSARQALGEQYGSPEAPLPIEGAIAPTLHRLRFDNAIKAWPKVSIIIPSRDSYELISRLLEDLTTRTDYPEREIIVVDNGTTDARVLKLYEQARAQVPGFQVEIKPEAFNFSRQVNRGIRLAAGEHVLLLNNDIKVTDSQWLREMVSCLAYPRTGIVGARLLYPDRSLQHAGVIVGLSGLAGHWYHAKPQDFPGMMGRLHVRQSLSAVTAACMLISRACLDEVGLFDEEVFAVAYNDVDYCLRAGKRGYRIVWTPFATLVHYESVSRGSDELPANMARFAREKAALRERHATDRFEDPAFSPWFNRGHSDGRLILLDRLPEPR
ncbi:glycosyltransferase [Vineibacter terrae]|uniref:Glycosyltransferase n=2 Tax=Vineibacter terrae TaxID=2586908 RepID=A0A5C8PNA2_9HYPH|nr:glycosyltransferase [Vineibacter terrae]